VTPKGKGSLHSIIKALAKEKGGRHHDRHTESLQNQREKKGKKEIKTQAILRDAKKGAPRRMEVFTPI